MSGLNLTDDASISKQNELNERNYLDIKFAEKLQEAARQQVNELYIKPPATFNVGSCFQSLSPTLSSSSNSSSGSSNRKTDQYKRQRIQQQQSGQHFDELNTHSQSNATTIGSDKNVEEKSLFLSNGNYPGLDQLRIPFDFAQMYENGHAQALAAHFLRKLNQERKQPTANKEEPTIEDIKEEIKRELVDCFMPQARQRTGRVDFSIDSLKCSSKDEVKLFDHQFDEEDKKTIISTASENSVTNQPFTSTPNKIQENNESTNILNIDSSISFNDCSSNNNNNVSSQNHDNKSGNISDYAELPEMPTMVAHVGRKPLNGPPCSLKTLVDDKILEPIESSLTYEILGHKFIGDLLQNGYIRMSGTSQVFANPSSWANYCRSTIKECNKDQKNYGSAWSIIRYCGKRLDSYKLRWYRKQKKQFNMTNGNSLINGHNNNNIGGGESSSSSINLSTNSNSSSICKQEREYVTAAATLSSLSSPRNGNHLTHRANLQQQQHQQQQQQQILLQTSVPRERFYKHDKHSSGDMELNAHNLNENNNVIQFANIDLINMEALDEQTKVCALPFSSVFCLQPFKVSFSTNVLLMIDYHAHLLDAEINGYLGGTWDNMTSTLSVLYAYPMQCGADMDIDDQRIADMREELAQKKHILVGWYHSHPHSVPHPTVGDIKRQVKYQKSMIVMQKGLIGYSPLIGLIISPYNRKHPKQSSLCQVYWVMPLLVPQCRDFGRPMQMYYETTRDAYLTQNLLQEMRDLAAECCKSDKFIKFREEYRPGETYFDKIKGTLKDKMPQDLLSLYDLDDHFDETKPGPHQALIHFWKFMEGCLMLPNGQQDQKQKPKQQQQAQEQTKILPTPKQVQSPNQQQQPKQSSSSSSQVQQPTQPPPQQQQPEPETQSDLQEELPKETTTTHQPTQQQQQTQQKEVTQQEQQNEGQQEEQQQSKLENNDNNDNDCPMSEKQ